MFNYVRLYQHVQDVETMQISGALCSHREVLSERICICVVKLARMRVINRSVNPNRSVKPNELLIDNSKRYHPPSLTIAYLGLLCCPIPFGCLDGCLL